jgi:leucine dehydrogenase
MSLKMEIEHIDGYEQVSYFTNDNDFQCYISIHNNKLGPALGGCRLKPYKTKDEALIDVLRLSKGMTYKSSLAGLNLGGGKCVVIAEKPTRDIMLMLGEAVNMLNGNFITGEDVGTTLSDVQIAGEITPYVVHQDGSSMTARGVLAGMRASLKYMGLDLDTFNAKTFIQGIGKVGYDLVARLAEGKDDNSNIQVSDLHQDIVDKAIAEFGVSIGPLGGGFIFSPCAMGQVITADNAHNLGYTVICGSANNQLVSDDLAQVLKDNGKLYCPDYLVNAGGVIDAACEVGQPYDQKLSENLTDGIGDKLLEILEIAFQENSTPLEVANRMAEERFT